ncbi:hypothetical protein [Aromatoleum anaerobium]|uniref:Secreted protein n=1 Tax=Aromatoleum anaerobium TaxID=182180 RepID=A0ABX1PLJ6_9RHOO|nr:hypothetical protein [Aromatoleum anaerobium]MCK0507319.1 hypothetical protein [Aromatoleum anaerobium]
MYVRIVIVIFLAFFGWNICRPPCRISKALSAPESGLPFLTNIYNSASKRRKEKCKYFRQIVTMVSRIRESRPAGDPSTELQTILRIVIARPAHTLNPVRGPARHARRQ